VDCDPLRPKFAPSCELATESFSAFTCEILALMERPLSLGLPLNNRPCFFLCPSFSFRSDRTHRGFASFSSPPSLVSLSSPSKNLWLTVYLMGGVAMRSLFSGLSDKGRYALFPSILRGFPFRTTRHSIYVPSEIWTPPLEDPPNMNRRETPLYPLTCLFVRSKEYLLLDPNLIPSE